MYLFAENFPEEGFFTPGTEETHHALNVLRMKTGDRVFLLDGKGRKAEAIILQEYKRSLQLEILGVIKDGDENPSRLSLAVCATKNIERLEWLTEKAIEAGVGSLFVIQSSRTERSRVNIDRLQKIAISALKQCGRLWMTELHALQAFRQHLTLLPQESNKWIAYCGEGEKISLSKAARKEGRHHILIGPEGDFEPEEIKQALHAGFLPLGLGETRLRTETAALLVSFAFSDCLE